MPGNATSSALVAVFKSTIFALAGVVVAAVLAGALPAVAFFACAYPLVASMSAHTPTSRNENSLRRFISNLLRLFYGMTTIGARQNAAFCPVASSTVTWQS